MKRVMTAIVTAVALWAVAGSTAQAAGESSGMDSRDKQPEKELKTQTTCPVMGGKISKALYVDHDGQRIYVCCKGCIEPVNKNPDKYIKKLESEGVTVAKLQTTCPVMGGKINKKQYVDHDGKRIYVCCPGCIGKIKADPEQYINKMEAAGIVLDASEASAK